ncbi:MAG TPA: RsmF rRNA methyltransferase first C-terminal domain-containing protein [Ruminiclostridium sp.]|nr:RsmF rRNA methyltransferase first C-terminal domain-containing protein [Ruminiclostridium sp.]
MTALPAAFLERMKSLPGFDFDSFIKAYEEPPFRGLRVNTLKCGVERFLNISPFQLSKVPFAEEGFYVGTEASGRHPLHHAGAFYFQEPSAMTAVTALDVKPGMRVLDLCAAPGGKSTQAAATLRGEGFILCNEVVPSRASILLSNIERCGVRNAAVTSEKTDKLCSRLEGFFDRVLVDAPCSGEGMFRRDPDAALEWNPDSPAACAKRQAGILHDASKAVAPGGILVYSTCTFSPDENEGVVDAFLKTHNNFVVEDIKEDFGRCAFPEWAGASKAVKSARRVFPFDGGEGHFAAKMRRIDGILPTSLKEANKKIDKTYLKLFMDFFKSQFSEELYGELHEAGGRIFILPREMPDLSGINLLRAGVFAGNIKGSRFEPSHALYMAAKSEYCNNSAEYALDDVDLERYLHGEEITAPQNCQKGYAAVKADGFVTGFGKVSNGVLKNHYPKGLRNL